MRMVETGLLPDGLVRTAVRLILERGLRQRYRAGQAARAGEKRALVAQLKRSPIAIHTDDPNWQHYEVPAEFFQLVLGKWLKYSCCYWPDGVGDLDAAEEAMLELTCRRARLEDGMRVLDLGCGWGSLTLWIAENFPNCRVLAVSNSNTQREFILDQCRLRGLKNVSAMTANMAGIEDDRRFNEIPKFDRVISIEMFEHMKNYERLLARIAGLLRSEGLLFVHIFSHREFARHFDAGDPNDWMATTFFSGGIMPSDDLLLYFQRDLKIIDHWRVDGVHYEKTLNAWLARLDANQAAVKAVLAQTYGPELQKRWLANWRMFFLSCAETWGLRNGREYIVSHYLFER